MPGERLPNPCAPAQSRLTLCDPMDYSRTRLLCPWDSPGKNTGVGCHFLLQGIFPTQGSNPSLLCLLHGQVGSLPLSPVPSKIDFKAKTVIRNKGTFYNDKSQSARKIEKS